MENMNDEEKQAIEGLKGSQKWIRQQIRLGNLPNYNQGHYADIQIVLNLIEKQSKEIEELKKYEEGYKLLSYSLDNYTSNDKIKAKIEEVEQWELYNMKIPRLSTLDERLGAKIGIKYVLQSLLEKE